MAFKNELDTNGNIITTEITEKDIAESLKMKEQYESEANE